MNNLCTAGTLYQTILFAIIYAQQVHYDKSYIRYVTGTAVGYSCFLAVLLTYSADVTALGFYLLTHPALVTGTAVGYSCFERTGTCLPAGYAASLQAL